LQLLVMLALELDAGPLPIDAREIDARAELEPEAAAEWCAAPPAALARGKSVGWSVGGLVMSGGRTMPGLPP